MALELLQISDVGVDHPVVARLGPQAADLIKWIDVDEAKREQLTKLYATTLLQRLLDCHNARDNLVRKIGNSIEKLPKQSNPQVREIPQVLGLKGVTEAFLYNTKNYLRDLLGLFQIVYDCNLKEASSFVDLNGNGDSDIVKWATAEFGADHNFTKLLKTEDSWAEFIRMRNAVEHPGEKSGTLTIENIRVLQNPEGYISPTWARSGRPESDIVMDMNTGVENMLTLAEDLLALTVLDNSTVNPIKVQEIPLEQRDPECPVRLKIGAPPELLEKIVDAAARSKE